MSPQHPVDWLQQWGDLGGSVHLEPDGKAMFGWPEYDLSPACRGTAVRPAEGGDEYLAASRAYARQMTAMLDDLQSTPGGIQSVKSLLRALRLHCFTGWTVQ